MTEALPRDAGESKQSTFLDDHLEEGSIECFLGRNLVAEFVRFSGAIAKRKKNKAGCGSFSGSFHRVVEQTVRAAAGLQVSHRRLRTAEGHPLEHAAGSVLNLR